ncbi:MAG: response regulator [Candidatus Rokuibacteriota bacterium]
MSLSITERRSPRVLVVEDESHVRSMLCDLLAMWGCRADSVPSATQGLDLLEHSAYDLLLTDFRMPEMTGVELVERVRTRDPRLSVIMLTASAADLDATGRRLGFTLLRKPLQIEGLKAALHEALDRPPAAAPVAAAPAAVAHDGS